MLKSACPLSDTKYNPRRNATPPTVTYILETDKRKQVTVLKDLLARSHTNWAYSMVVTTSNIMATHLAHFINTLYIHLINQPHYNRGNKHEQGQIVNTQLPKAANAIMKVKQDAKGSSDKRYLIVLDGLWPEVFATGGGQLVLIKSELLPVDVYLSGNGKGMPVQGALCCDCAIGSDVNRLEHAFHMELDTVVAYALLECHDYLALTNLADRSKVMPLAYSPRPVLAGEMYIGCDDAQVWHWLFGKKRKAYVALTQQ
ncbi:uncharacterized protein ACA1_134070 [Acanthamoeba castellanii str. Neff]|uniref:Uncharacterized protein n=1 Tax=Acanthamoeba castellanii (strain ATCC 30010 / Neff) TaxID=1257118 RepID=L8GGL9_ACACF|nr:uncharacterized protein ACA1_134070 [Acanthamoeba castellanii str. Neff]ELR11351.1 hypothetical protein ACA1_134070 [Acanthamoeba castellanii str. Neff]